MVIGLLHRPQTGARLHRWTEQFAFQEAPSAAPQAPSGDDDGEPIRRRRMRVA
jgi:hypothetical protein